MEDTADVLIQTGPSLHITYTDLVRNRIDHNLQD